MLTTPQPLISSVGFAELLSDPSAAFIWDTTNARPSWANAAGRRWLGLGYSDEQPRPRSRLARELNALSPVAAPRSPVLLNSPGRPRQPAAPCHVAPLTLAGGHCGWMVRPLAAGMQLHIEPALPAAGLAHSVLIAAHDIRNALTAAGGYAELVERDGKRATRHAAAMQDAVAAAMLALEKLTEAAGGDAPLGRPELVLLGDLARRALRLAQPKASAAGVQLSSRLSADSLMQPCPPQLQGALLNLLLNGIEHGGNTVRLTARMMPGALQLRVSDTGEKAGFAAIAIALNAKTHARRRGHGLASARAAVEQAGGTLQAQRLRGRTALTLQLPQR